MRNKAVLHGRWSVVVLCLSFCGCTAINDCTYECGQKLRTSRAWHEFDGCSEDCFTSDYRRGWKAGYYDVLTGHTGCPPLIAPKRYWKPPVFCEYDPNRRNDWYCGFQDGASCAKCQPDHHYLQVWSPCAPTCCQTQTMGPTHIEFARPIDASPGCSLGEPQPGEPQPGELHLGEPVHESTAEGMFDPPMTGSEGAVEPAPSVEPATKNPEGSDYEKDPEPSSTGQRIPPEWISHDLIMSNCRPPHAGRHGGEGPCVLRLVANAARNRTLNTESIASH